MTTTSLFVEILVIGAVAELWLALFLLALAPQADLAAFRTLVSDTGELTALLFVPFVALTYALGWVVNFLAERLFKPFFQERYRDALFQEASVDYYTARATVLQRASEEVVADLQFDRHIFRIARAGALNFLLLAIALVPYIIAGRSWLSVLLALFLGLSISSFLQWRSRYGHSYRKLLRAYNALKEVPSNETAR